MSAARDTAKALAHAVATLLALPALLSYFIRSHVMGPDRALEGSTQALAWLPGVTGQYVRRAFLSYALARCARSSTIEYGTIFSKAGARIDDGAYIGPRCHLGLVHIESAALLAAGVHVPSGGRTHGSADATIVIRDQPGELREVTIGRGAWIGSAAVVLADVGEGTIVGAGAVVTSPLPPMVVAGGVPARIIRQRAIAGEPM